jgi:hypothetical protein
VSRILGHKVIAGTIAATGIYDRFDRLPEIRSSLVAWSNHVRGLVTDEEKQGELVAFGRASEPRQASAKRTSSSGLIV